MARAGVRQFLKRRRFDQDTRELSQESPSERELRVFCKIAAGQAMSEIAREFSLSDNTVSTYRTRILEKMILKKNAKLTGYATRNELMQ